MRKELQKIWKNLSETLSEPIRICKICFNPIKSKRIDILMEKHALLCDKCSDLFRPIWLRFKHFGCRCLAIYHYDQTIRTYLYQFKGCHDYELYPVFLYHYAKFLHYRYRNYIIIPAPSFPLDDEERGFNHVEMIYSVLNLKIYKMFTKLEHHKQADCNMVERREIYKYLQVNNTFDIKGKKILLVDDVFTSGETMKALIKLLRPFGPKKIEIMVISKTIL